MKKIEISIVEEDMVKYGLNSQKMDFYDLLKKIELNIAKEALMKSQEFAVKGGIDKMTDKEIQDEIQAVRNAEGSLRIER